MEKFEGFKIPTNKEVLKEVFSKLQAEGSERDKNLCSLANTKSCSVLGCSRFMCNSCLLHRSHKETFKKYMSSDNLKEGKDEVREFKVGDRVECIKPIDELQLGEIYTISKDFRDGCFGLKHLKVFGFKKERFKLATNKPTTKEETMSKDNNVNPDVQAVFGEEVTGNELLVIDRHFTPAMLQKILMDKHSKAIHQACKDAESERIIAEAAAKK